MKRIAVAMIMAIVAVGALAGDDDIYVPPYGSYLASHTYYNGVLSLGAPMTVLRIKKGTATLSIDLNRNGLLETDEMLTFPILDRGKLYEGRFREFAILISYSPDIKSAILLMSKPEDIYQGRYNSGARYVFSEE